MEEKLRDRSDRPPDHGHRAQQLPGQGRAYSRRRQVQAGDPACSILTRIGSTRAASCACCAPETDIENYAAEVAPSGGLAFIFRVQSNSWHGHKRFIGPRRYVMLNYCTDSRNRENRSRAIVGRAGLKSSSACSASAISPSRPPPEQRTAERRLDFRAPPSAISRTGIYSARGVLSWPNLFSFWRAPRALRAGQRLRPLRRPAQIQ